MRVKLNQTSDDRRKKRKQLFFQVRHYTKDAITFVCIILEQDWKMFPEKAGFKVFSPPSFEKWKVDQKWLLQRRAWRLFFVDTKYYCTFKAGPALRVNFLLATIMPARLHLALVLFCSCISTINATLRNDWILLLLNDFSHVFSDADKKLSLLPKFAFVALTFCNLPKSKKAECNTSFLVFVHLHFHLMTTVMT